MAPSVNKDGTKNSKMIVRRLLNKFYKLNKSPEEKIKKDNKYDYVVFDSVPDELFEKKPAEASGQQPEPEKMVNNETSSKNEQKTCESDDEIPKEEEFTEKTKEEKKQEKKRTTRTEQNESRDPPSQTIYMNITDVGSFHLGTSITNTYNFQQTINAKKQVKRSEKERPAKVEAALQSTVKLGSDHIEFLSDHFGKSCREIGFKLDVTSGQIDQIEDDCGNDAKQIAFEILSIWMRKNGDKATLGRLCQQLWKSKIPRAREAVTKLSDNIDNFN